MMPFLLFQSTHPRGGATGVRGGGRGFAFDFNPRTHVGVRQDGNRGSPNSDIFQSTHPRGGATVKPSNGWLLGHKDNEFANENIIIINSVNIT